jgi:hypothetical protein
MAEKVKFKVLRRHEGDRVYEEGDTREGTEAELGHLVPKVLERMDASGADSPEPAPADGGAKAETVSGNKMEAAPANKAEAAATTRSKGKKRGR